MRSRLFSVSYRFTLGADRSRVDGSALMCIITSAAVLSTTIHAQDFKDVDGDRIVGRSTLPIAFPRLSRASMIVGLLAWSTVLAQLCQLDMITASLLLALGGAIGLRFLRYDSVSEDQFSYLLYNVRAFRLIPPGGV